MNRHTVIRFEGEPGGRTVEAVLTDGRTTRPLSPRLAQAFSGRSCGFSWGSKSPECRQLAFALLAVYFEPGIAPRYADCYAEQVLSDIPEDSPWIIETAHIARWLRENKWKVDAEGRFSTESELMCVEFWRKPAGEEPWRPDVNVVELCKRKSFRFPVLTDILTVAECWTDLRQTTGPDLTALDPKAGKVPTVLRQGVAASRGFYRLHSELSRFDSNGRRISVWIKPSRRVEDALRGLLQSGLDAFTVEPWYHEVEGLALLAARGLDKTRINVCFFALQQGDLLAKYHEDRKH